MAFAPIDDPRFREGQTISPLEVECCLYQWTHNPLYALSALVKCKARMLAAGVPPSVVEFMIAGASTVLEGPGNDPDVDIPTFVGAAFGFKPRSQGQKGDEFQEAQAVDLEWKLARAVWRYHREFDKCITESVTAISERTGVGEKTVRGAWKTWEAQARLYDTGKFSSVVFPE